MTSRANGKNIIHTIIRVTNDLVHYREGGRQCCFMNLSALLFDGLGSSSCCHWTAENVGTISWNLATKWIFRFFAAGTEGLIPDTETLSISIPPFAVRWIAESSKAIGLPTSQTRTHARTTLAKNKTYQPTLARTKDILAETQKLGPKLIDCIQHP